MSAETERHELYEIAKHEVGDRFAELMMSFLPPHADRLATKDDVVASAADLRQEMATLRGELRTEMRDLTAGQTRTLMLGLVGSITALTATQLVVAALG
jgi:hypothetical protein